MHAKYLGPFTALNIYPVLLTQDSVVHGFFPQCLNNFKTEGSVKHQKDCILFC